MQNTAKGKKHTALFLVSVWIPKNRGRMEQKKFFEKTVTEIFPNIVKDSYHLLSEAFSDQV